MKKIEKARLDLEDRIEGWVEKDISLVSDNLLVIGRQVRTDFGGALDLMCLDSSGDVTIVELKRDLTPREVAAQLLEYASWVRDLSAARVVEIANDYLSADGPLEDAFVRKFSQELPDSLNAAGVNMLVVASVIDVRSERIMRFLSEEYGVSINAVTFDYFRSDDGKEVIARTFLLEPDQVEHQRQARAPSRRKPSPKLEELCGRADRNGNGEAFRLILEAARKHDLYPRPFANSVMYGPAVNRNRSLFTVSVGSHDGGGPNATMSYDAWQDFFPVTEEQVKSALGPPSRWNNLTYEKAQEFVGGLDRLLGLEERME